MASQPPSLMEALRDLAKLIREFGMQIVIFAMGLYVIWVGVSSTTVLKAADLDSEFVIFIGILLTLVGLVSGLWIYSRENPPAPPTEALTNPEIKEMLEWFREQTELQLSLSRQQGARQTPGNEPVDPTPGRP